MLDIEFEFYSPNANPKITVSTFHTEILFELVYSLRSEAHHIHDQETPAGFLILRSGYTVTQAVLFDTIMSI